MYVYRGYAKTFPPSVSPGPAGGFPGKFTRTQTAGAGQRWLSFGGLVPNMTHFYSTLTELSDRHDIPRWRLSYIIKSRCIVPDRVAGKTHLFNQSTSQYIIKEALRAERNSHGCSKRKGTASVDAGRN
jgi:hypothetical protein